MRLGLGEVKISDSGVLAPDPSQAASGRAAFWRCFAERPAVNLGLFFHLSRGWAQFVILLFFGMKRTEMYLIRHFRRMGQTQGPVASASSSYARPVAEQQGLAIAAGLGAHSDPRVPASPPRRI